MLHVRRHDGQEFGFGRRGKTLALLLPQDATVEEGIARFRDHLSVDELDVLYAYAATAAA